MTTPTGLNISPVILAGRRVRLEPLSVEHHEELCEVGLEDELWRLIPYAVRSREDMLDYIRTALQAQADGTALPFATIDQASNRAVGCTRFMNIDKPNRRVEIGATWVGLVWQRTPVNTEAKYLMLRHAFERLGCIRVELKTDVLNERSRKAILRIGAKQEGIFRNHIVCHDGRIRDTVWFSIIDSEWPEVRAELLKKLER
jgi:RimJ/RimL family protein N-acetyltransferase